MPDLFVSVREPTNNPFGVFLGVSLRNEFLVFEDDVQDFDSGVSIVIEVGPQVSQQLFSPIN